MHGTAIARTGHRMSPDSTPRIALLQLEAMLPERQGRLEQLYEVHRLPAEAAARDALLAEHGARLRGVVTGGGSGITPALVERLPALEIVAINGVGTDAVDLEHARARGLRVTNTPDVLTDDVADLAMALMLAASRQLLAGDRFVREGRWARREALPLTRKVSGRRLGIVGLGRIGAAVARRAEGFGMSIRYHNRRPAEGVPYPYAASVLELARDSDVLVVAAAGGAGSRDIVGRAEMEALGPDGILVNVARGSVVDEPALVEALRSGALGGAGLDVFADEPNVPAELIGLDHLVLQPHRASATLQTRVAMAELVLDNLAAHFGGRELLTAVV